MLRFPAASQPNLSNETITPLCLSPLVWMASSFWQLKFLQAAAVNTQTMEPMSTDLFTCLTNNCFPSLTSRITSRFHLLLLLFLLLSFPSLMSPPLTFPHFMPHLLCQPCLLLPFIFLQLPPIYIKHPFLPL